jgi:AcrR family transcriptional regulator
VTARPTAAARPRNRRQLIVEAAGRVFSERGYHAASMEEIAANVGITAAALYRHFPNKYALFAECANVMVDGLVAALAELPADAAVADVLGAITRVTVAHRASGGLYRWEARYLDRDDRRVLRGKFAHLVGQVTEAVRREYPQPGEQSRAAATFGDRPLPCDRLLRGEQLRTAAAPGEHALPGDRLLRGEDLVRGEDSLPSERLRAAAALGVIGSITMHHTSIAQRRVEEILVESAIRVVATDPASGPARARLIELPAQPVPRTRRAEILAAAIPLFEKDGFATVTNGRIAEAVGLAPSALYRHFPGKVDILAAACLQAAALLAQAVEQNLRDVTDPHNAVIALASTYVAYSFEHTALTSVANAEVAGLPAEVREPVVLAQREHIAVWERQLRLARPGLDPRQARVLVHAGFGVVVEAGRGLRWQDLPEHRDAVTALLVSALGL